MIFCPLVVILCRVFKIISGFAVFLQTYEWHGPNISYAGNFCQSFHNLHAVSTQPRKQHSNLHSNYNAAKSNQKWRLILSLGKFFLKKRMTELPLKENDYKPSIFLSLCSAGNIIRIAVENCFCNYDKRAFYKYMFNPYLSKGVVGATRKDLSLPFGKALFHLFKTFGVIVSHLLRST